MTILDGEKSNANDGQWNPVVFVKPHIVAVPRQIWGIALEDFCFIAESAVQDPSHMGPPLPITRRMWVSPFIGIPVVHAMYAYPVDRPTLESKRSAGSNAILQPLWSGVSP